MASPSLYRRYRPRRFAELKGQDHVVRALREAVRSGREGQGYLFSGPRGTGKTTSARILAKVLNCESPVDGEPCCECPPCLAVEAGTSYDVHELDAASNNGVDAMRELIERASLGTPGRHKVYILDEVHMLSRAAEAALLKTLEEPPDHVVFVLATTDPQRVSETIRSRTQHLRFHLLPAETLADHVRWVAGDAGLDVDDHAVDLAVAQGGGSARDTLSALELIVAGGDDEDPTTTTLDDYVEALTARDAGQALSVIARAVNLGDDTRTLTDRLVRHLRDGFLALMAPDLVQLPVDRRLVVADAATALGAPRLVRGIELLGEMLVEMRHVPEPRVLLEVATVRLCTQDAPVGTEALEDRLTRLEHAVDALASGTAAAAVSPASSSPPVSTGARAEIGARAQRRVPSSDASAPAGVGAEAPPPPTSAPTQDVTPAESAPAKGDARAAGDVAVTPAALQAVWTEKVLTGLKPLPRALFTAGTITGSTTPDGRVAFAVASDRLRERCDEQRRAVEAAAAAALGAPVRLDIQVAAGGAGGGGHDGDGGGDKASAAGSSASGARAAGDVPAADPDDVDPDDLVDGPVDHDPLAHLTNAFPGSEIVADPDTR